MLDRNLFITPEGKLHGGGLGSRLLGLNQHNGVGTDVRLYFR